MQEAIFTAALGVESAWFVEFVAFDMVHKRLDIRLDFKRGSKFEVEDLCAHGGKPENISDVSCDMSPAFIKGVAENLPHAQITFDKFHILKIINEAVDEVRREEAKTNPLLANPRYVFLKNEANLTARQREKKAELLIADMNIKSMEALRMRENFQAIYRVFTTGQFVKYLRAWVKWVSNSGLQPMEKAASMVLNHWDGIVRRKQSQINNGILEGLNSTVQAAKRKARAYKLNHLITMTYLLTGKLNLSNVKPAHHIHLICSSAMFFFVLLICGSCSRFACFLLTGACSNVVSTIVPSFSTRA